jgi:glucokinase
VSVAPLSLSSVAGKSHTADYPMLVADIGGTNARFGWVTHAHAPLQDVVSLTCADFAGPAQAAQHYLAQQRGHASPARMAVGVASVVTDAPIKLTNSAWVLDRRELESTVGATRVDVFNDFEAIALALPYLTADDTVCVRGPKMRASSNSTMGVIGPGTGLGVAGVVPVRGMQDQWQTICGEGGHVTLSANNDYHHAILQAARAAHTHVSAERLLSGIGLPTLRNAVASVQGVNARDVLTAEEIGSQGAARTDHLCEQTMEVFCALLGCVAGNLALTLGARGGVFIGGGIVPKLGQFFHESAFREHFEKKGRYESYLKEIPTPVITHPHPGLAGLAHFAGR